MTFSLLSKMKQFWGNLRTFGTEPVMCLMNVYRFVTALTLHCVNIRSILFTYHPRSNREMIQSWITYLLCKSTYVSVPWLLYIIVTTAHSKNHPTVTLGCDGWMNGQMGLSWAVDNAFPCSTHGFFATCVALLYVNSSKLKDCGKTVRPHRYIITVLLFLLHIGWHIIRHILPSEMTESKKRAKGRLTGNIFPGLRVNHCLLRC